MKNIGVPKNVYWKNLVFVKYYSSVYKLEISFFKSLTKFLYICASSLDYLSRKAEGIGPMKPWQPKQIQQLLRRCQLHPTIGKR